MLRFALITILAAIQLSTVSLATDDPSSCSEQIGATTFVSKTKVVVIGAPTDRIYLPAQRPDACESSTTAECKPSAYIVGGDTVDAGQTCGSWTAVRFHAMTREYFGWVRSESLTVSYLNTAEVQADSTSSPRYSFHLTRGKALPVCQAYQKRLDRTLFERTPRCGIPEDDSVPGFSRLNRIYLSKDEIERLWPAMWSFVSRSHESDAPDPGWPASAARARVGDSLFAWRYLPLLSIDNNGNPDNILVEQGVGLGFSNGMPLQCGQAVTYGPQSVTQTLELEQTPLVLTTDSNRIDEARTRTLFAHPKGQTVHTRTNGDLTLEGFRTIGNPMGFFKYQDLYYFEAFYGEWTGDIEGKRIEGPSLKNTLAVFLRKDGLTQQVCEYQMSETDGLADIFFKSKSTEARIKALEDLNARESPDRRKFNEIALRDPSSDVRNAALDNLGGDPKYFVPILIETMAHDSDEKIREKAAIGLSSYFTSNGSEGCAEAGAAEAVEKNLPPLLSAVKDSITNRYAVEVLGAEYSGLTPLPCCMSGKAKQQILGALRDNAKAKPGGWAPRAIANLENCSTP